jgi:t-SNARE complex subunit (syntaxin)
VAAESTVARIDLEQENALLMETFTSDLDEVHAASNKVTEITRLQAILASKIEEQATQLDAVYANTVEAVENVAQGNEQLRKAIRSSIDFRMGVFLFYLMCSFCLLFLHWYD